MQEKKHIHKWTFPHQKKLICIVTWYFKQRFVHKQSLAPTLGFTNFAFILPEFTFQWIYWCKNNVDCPGENPIRSGISCPCCQDHACSRGLECLLQGLILKKYICFSIINFWRYYKKEISFCFQVFNWNYLTVHKEVNYLSISSRF